MYRHCNGSGAFVSVNQHKSKAYLQKRIRLIVSLSSIAVTTVSRFCFAEYFARNAGVGSGMQVGVNGKCQLVLLDFDHN